MSTELQNAATAMETKAPRMLELVWCFDGVSIFFIAIRMFTQIKVVGQVGVSDYLMLAALVYSSPVVVVGCY